MVLARAALAVHPPAHGRAGDAELPGQGRVRVVLQQTRQSVGHVRGRQSPVVRSGLASGSTRCGAGPGPGRRPVCTGEANQCGDGAGARFTHGPREDRVLARPNAGGDLGRGPAATP